MAFTGGVGAQGGTAGGAYNAIFPAHAASSQILREDLLDAAINLDKQKKAAVFLAAPKTVANGLTHEWLIDQLPATSTAGDLEGNDWASASDAKLRTRLFNTVQTFRRNFAVTMDMIEYSLKGRSPSVSNEYEHQVENFLLATEQSVDARVLANASVAAVEGTSAATTALMGTIRNWQAGTATATGVVQAAVTNTFQASIGGQWSRSKFLALHEAMYGAGSDPDTLAVDPGVKSDITQDVLGEVATTTATGTSASSIYGYATPQVIRQLHTDGSGTEYTQDIQFMRTDFGRIAILIDRFCPSSGATSASANNLNGAFFLYERAKVRVAFWRPLRHYPLPPTGDSMRGYVHTGATLELLHPGTVGVGYNITT